MEPTPRFARIDTIILRVRDLERARAWYAAALGLTAVYHDPAEGLAVLPVGETGSLTLWQLKPGEVPPGREAAGTYPIFAAADAAADRDALLAHGVEVEPLAEGPGVRFFAFRDPDGNRLEACQVLETASVEADA
jgi:catechol 2,3-dioxygenase-like lactoylglutathione lyase family enzyme